MEDMLSDYIKEGWQPKGELSYVTTDLHVWGSGGKGLDKRTHLVQTIVKYETPTDLNLFDCGPCRTQITESKPITEDLLEINM
jgi:hypothetical protein